MIRQLVEVVKHHVLVLDVVNKILFEESFSVRERENVYEDIKNAFMQEGLPGIVKDISVTSQAGTNICNKLANKWNCSKDAAEIIFDTVVNGDMLGSRKGDRKGGYYNDALQAHGVYHGYQDWEDVSFVPEDEALETLGWIAEDEGKTVDQLVSELYKFRQENNK